jgi:hypothetical protein
MSTTFILPEDADPKATNVLLDEVCLFIVKIAARCDEDNIGRVNKIDEKFIEEYAEGFHELRSVGTKGLCEKYVGRYYINLYGHVPLWAQDMIVDLTKAQKIVVKEKKSRDDWD